MSLTAAERETIITFSDDNQTAHVHTAQRRIITKLDRNPAANLVKRGEFEGTAFAEFTIPADLISFRSARRKRELTEAERESLRERGRRLASSRRNSTNSINENEDNLAA